MLDEESEKRIALEEKFQKRVRNRLKEQRLEIESENEENLAKILQAHKNEIEALSGKIAANKNAKVRHSTVVYTLPKNLLGIFFHQNSYLKSSQNLVYVRRYGSQSDRIKRKNRTIAAKARFSRKELCRKICRLSSFEPKSCRY